MNGINIETSVTLDHAKLGAEVWEWDSDQQADFLAEFGRTFRRDPGKALMQLSFIVAELKREPWKIASVRWLNEHLTEYLKEDTNA